MFAARCSEQLTAHGSLLTAHGSLLIAHCSLLCNQLVEHLATDFIVLE